MYKALFESTSDALLVLEKGQIVDCNPAALQLFKCERSDLVDHPFHKTFPLQQPDGQSSRKFIEDKIKHIEQNGEPLHFQCQQSKLGGSIIRSDIKVTPINLDGQTFCQVTIREKGKVSKQRVLKQSQDQLRYIFNNIELIVVSFNPPDEIVFINDCGLELLGWDREEIIGESWFENMVPEYRREESKEKTRKIYEEETALSYQFENPILTKDGREEVVRWHTSIITDEEGNRIGMNTIGEVVTDKRKAQQTIERLFEFTLNPLCIAGIDGYFKKVNPAFEKTLGYTQEELTSNPFFDFVYPEDREATEKTLEKLQYGGTVESFENRYVGKDGSITWFLWQAIPGEDSHLIYASATDITHIKNVEQELELSRQQFKSIFHQAAVGVAKVSLEGKFLKVNRTLCDILGYEKDELLENHFNDFTHPEDRVKGEKFRKKLIKGEFNNKTFEKRYIRKDGKIIIVRLTVNLVRDKESHPSYFVSVFEDVTARKKAEKELEQSNSLLQATFEASVDGILAVDADQNVITYNQKFLELWDIPENTIDQMDDQVLIDYVLPKLKEPESFIQKVEHLYENLEKESHDLIELKDGRIFERHAKPQYRNGNTIGRVWNFRDITEKVNTANALAKSEKRYRSLVQSSSDLVTVLNRTGQIHYVNSSLDRLLNYTEKEWKGQSLFDFVHPEDVEGVKTLFNKLLEQKHIETPIEFRFLTKSGSSRYLELKGTNLLDDPAIQGIVFNCREVTERKLALENLKESETRFRTLVGNLPGVVYRCSYDQQWSMYFMSENIESISGYKPGELVHNKKKSYSQIIHPDDRQKVYNEVTNSIKKQTPFEIEYRMIHKNGSIRWIHERGQGVRNKKNEVLYLDGLIFDITEEKRQERTKEIIYNVSSAANQIDDLQELGRYIQQELNSVLDARNFYIALIDERKQEIDFPYYVDQTVDNSASTSYSRPYGRGLTEYLVEQGNPLLLTKQEIEEIKGNQNVIPNGNPPNVWLGVPLRHENEVKGAIVLQNYEHHKAYVHSDLKLLGFLGNQIASVVERIQKEQALQHTNKRLQDFFDNSYDLILSLDPQGNIIYANKAFEHIFDYSKEELYTLNIKELIHPHDQHTFEQRFHNIKEGENIQNIEFAFLGKDQQRVDVVGSMRAYIENGEFVSCWGDFHNITERKKAERQLKRSEAKFRSIFESIQDLYYRTDREGFITRISPSVKKIVGYEPHEVMGTKVTSHYVNPEKREELLKELEENGVCHNFDTALYTKEGDVIYVSVNSHLVYDDQDNPVAVEGTVRDITEKRKAEEQLVRAKTLAEEAAQAKTQFIANISHELKTPLNGIYGMIDLLKTSSLNEEQQEQLESIDQSAQTLSYLINDLLELSKIEGQEIRIKPVNCQLSDLINHTLQPFQQKADQKGIELRQQLSEDLPQYIKADRMRINQILNNLLDNAIKFTSEGSVCLKVDSEKSNTPQQHLLQFSITDTGIGIAEEEKSQLFERFTQIDAGLDREYEGTGLGLAISYELVQFMGGEMGVESKKGKGSTFWFRIPVQEGSPEEDIPTKNGEPDINEVKIDDSSLSSTQILVMEDNPTNQKVIKRMIHKLGGEATIADNGREGLQYVNDNSYDAILLDIQMPDFDGWAVIDEIKKRQPSLLKKVVLLTAKPIDESDKTSFRQYGIRKLLSKPIRLKQLQQTLNEYSQKPLTNGQEHHTPQQESEKSAVSSFRYAEQLLGDEWESIVQDFITNTEKLIDQLETYQEPLLHEALPADQIEEIRKMTHSIKGSASALYCQPLAEVAKTIQEAIADHEEHNDPVDQQWLAGQINDLTEKFVNLKYNFNKKKAPS